jgi:mannose-6-phosphate isomerase-like protein (cupin superfamily)
VHIVNNAQVRKFYFPDLVQQTLAGPETGLQTFEVWLMTLKAGSESAPHHHPGEVVWVILKGSGRATVAGEVVQVGSNTTISIPAGACRQLINTGSDEMVMLTIRGMIPSQQTSHAEASPDFPISGLPEPPGGSPRP